MPLPWTRIGVWISKPLFFFLLLYLEDSNLSMHSLLLHFIQTLEKGENVALSWLRTRKETNQNSRQQQKRGRTVSCCKVYALRTQVLFKVPCLYYTPELIYTPKTSLSLANSRGNWNERRFCVRELTSHEDNRHYQGTSETKNHSEVMCWNFCTAL